jgi:penicillin-binding protein 1A
MIVSNKKLLYFFCLLAGILLTSLSFFFWSAPDIGSGFNYAVVVHSADGGELAEFYKERRFFVPHQAIPVRVKEAFLAAEDQRFYSHHGFDIRGILRAFRKNIAANRLGKYHNATTRQDDNKKSRTDFFEKIPRDDHCVTTGMEILKR